MTEEEETEQTGHVLHLEEMYIQVRRCVKCSILCLHNRSIELFSIQVR